jgi:putative membrane protein
MLILAGGASVVAASPAFAQKQPASAEMGKPEMEHMQETMKAGSLSLATSRVAVQKATNAEIKQFAQFEVAEQEGIAEVLKSMKGDNMPATSGAAPNAEVQANLDDKGKATLKKLQDAKSGAEFDREYVKVQTDGHNELLKIQENYIKAGRVREHVNVAKLARGHIKEHISRLQGMKA